MNVLAVDIGNSNIKVGWWNETELKSTAVESSGSETQVGQSLEAALSKYLMPGTQAIGGTQGELRCIVSSVVPRLTPTVLSLIEQNLGIKPLVLTHKLPLPIGIGYAAIEQLGTDRIAGAAGAVAVVGAPVVVIDAGTAVTMNVVNADRVFLGGTIIPGARLWAKALSQYTAALPLVQFESTDSDPPQPTTNAHAVIATNTEDAIRSGITWGLGGAVDRLVQKARAELGTENVPVILTGGARALIAGRAKTINKEIPDLTLRGLVEIATYQTK